MPRKRTHEAGPRSCQILIRVTEQDYAQLAMDAGRLGMTVSGLSERLLLEGKIAIAQADAQEMHPTLLAELRRIGNNLNQLAHAANGLLPPSSQQLAKDFSQLFNLIVQNELIVRRMNQELEPRTRPVDPPPSQAR